MTRYIAKRLFHLVFVLIAVSVVIFSIIHLAPGDPLVVLLGERATPEQMEKMRQAFGLDKPLYFQYLLFMRNALEGNFGISIRHGVSSGSLIFARLPVTMELVLASMVIAVPLSILAGIIASLRQNTWWDYFASFFSLFGVSIPSFWIGIMLILTLGVFLEVFPVMGRPEWSLWEAFLRVFHGEWRPLAIFLHYLFLPALTNALWMMGLVTRLTRTSMLEVLREDYVRTARGKGLRERWVIVKHALKNALIPVITVIGIQFGSVLGGAVITETVFSWPGMGRLMIDSVYNRDYPVVQAGVIICAFLFAMVNLIVDFLYTLLDPRIKY
jgi:ABC-type dipeptide/oligopeptide/nickel transport system permease component